MCGIGGVLSFNQKVDITSIQNMISTLHHRGPDGEGVWLNDSQQIGLGHKRLSILDLSETGKQPMHFANNRYSITFNGEIYNYLELKGALIEKGYTFISSSDTEVLLALYDLKKEKVLEELDGMFAFAIWDNIEKKLFCARDRFGEKPFYYHLNKNYFAFASEMKALFTLGINKAKNQKKIYNYLLYTTLEDPFERGATFYENIRQLEPGHYLIISPEKEISNKKYWDINITQPINISEKEAVLKFRKLFESSVSRRLRSDVPVGSSLSGGLDSSSIVMLIDSLKKEGHIQKTFSARFNNFNKDEGRFMQMVVDKSTVEPHYVFPTIESVIKNFPTILKHQEEPIGSASVAIQYEVMQLAKNNGITVLLDGQGADEMLAGYKIFWNTYFNQLYRSDRNKFNSETISYQNIHDETPYINNLEFKWRANNNNSFKFFSEFKRKTKSPKSDYFLGIDPDIVSRYKDEPNPIPKVSSLKEHLHYFLMKRGLSELLRYADRNAMANSVEVRLPFLNHTLVEFLFTLPDDLLLHSGWSKYILRKSMEDLLPAEITWRKDKIGFEPPQEQWLNSSYFKNYLNEAIYELKRDHIIVNANPQLTWNYISLFAFNQIK
jgi:asparagine synthase (glutamine-hydrolysing)